MVEKPLDQPLVAMVPSVEPPPTIPTADWRVQFIQYLTDGSGPTNKVEVERLMHRSKQYVLVDRSLMRKNTKEEILMKCIT